MIDTTGAVDVAKTPALLEPLVLPPSIEPRAAAFYVKSHRRAAFEAAFQELCGEDFRLFSREEALASGLLGRGTPHPKLDDFLGDYLGVATGRRYFAFSLPGARPGDSLIGQMCIRDRIRGDRRPHRDPRDRQGYCRRQGR